MLAVTRAPKSGDCYGAHLGPQDGLASSHIGALAILAEATSGLKGLAGKEEGEGL